MRTEDPLDPKEYEVREKLVRPGQLNLLRHDTFHRVDLLEEDAWSLFMVGPIVSSWGFWNSTTGVEIDHKLYSRKGAGQS